MTKQAMLPSAIGITKRRLIAVVGMSLLMFSAFAHRALAQGDDAGKILKTMSDYMTSQKAISLTFDSDIEVITPELQKLQFTSSGQVQLIRPNKFHATRTGGYKDVEMVFDGKTLTIHNKDNNSFAQLGATGAVDQLIDLLRDKYAVVAPGVDLLMSNVYDIMSADVIDAKHIGRGVIDGVECEHLAFRNIDTDWQIWIEMGARPIPRKYIITSKAVAGAPQYTLRVKTWQTDIAADTFVFKPPQGAKKVALEALEGIDEVPPGSVATGGMK